MGDKTNLPEWKKRRWILLNKFLNDTNVKKDLAKYAKWSGEPIIPLAMYGSMAEWGLPSECWDAVLLKLKKANASDQELIDAIQPPIEYLSHYHKVRGVAADPKARYEEERWKIERKMEVYGTDKASEDTGVYIRLSPFTSYTEVQKFIKNNWDEIQPLLDKSNHESDGEFDPDLLKPGVTKLRDRGNREALDSYIVELHSEGLKSPEIRSKVHDKYGMWIDESNIRKIVSRYKKRS